MMNLDYLMRHYTPGDGHSWDVEFRWLTENHLLRLYLLSRNIKKHGIREPILLGNDGRVRDGHHRITAAYMLGLEAVPVEHAKGDADAPTREELYQDWLETRAGQTLEENHE